MKKEDTLVAFGEALWDCLPNGLFLGGAPFNVAYHAARLGLKASPATCVGRDFLGDQVVDRAVAAGLGTGLIVRHPFLPTGVAVAKLDASANAKYDIRRPVAWDAIELDDAQMDELRSASVLVYGTLAARSPENRERLLGLLAEAKGLKLCDVNLRAPYDDRDRAFELARRADLVKLNEEELYVIIERDPKDCPLEDAILRARDELGCAQLCVTLGGDGALVNDGDEVVRVVAMPVKVADTIGAGDAFTAALAVSKIEGRGLREGLERAVKLGSFVASRDGAQPTYTKEEVFS